MSCIKDQKLHFQSLDVKRYKNLGFEVNLPELLLHDDHNKLGLFYMCRSPPRVASLMATHT